MTIYCHKGYNLESILYTNIRNNRERLLDSIDEIENAKFLNKDIDV